VEPFRRAVAELDPNVAILNLMPVPALIVKGNRDLVIVNQLLAGFAALGLFLAALGLYGVISRLVTQRAPEIGIRIALGATFDQVVYLVVGAGFRMMLFGVAVGLLGAVALTRVINAALPGLASNGAVTVSAAAALLTLVAVLACYVPARRAARVDPLAAIRSE
jgi:ABC-type antimicrobial peptide transport system permease subunit